MSDLTAERLVQRIMDADLLESAQIDALRAELGSKVDDRDALVAILLRKNLLTNFQIERLIKGERDGYFYGDYRVLYLTGSGTFARVYRAVHRTTGRIVAVKVLRKRHRQNKEETLQFLREGEIGAKLRHQNIVPIYEVSKDPNAPFLVMEFIEGRNLREFVKVRKKFTPMETINMGIDILTGLAYANERGMAHRDLKLSNVLVSSKGTAKLVDFGLASVAEGFRAGISDETVTARTIDYAGLERASGVRRDDPRSDLFFVGCILYQMISGTPALFETKERLQRMSVSRYSDIRPVTTLEPSCPAPLAALITRALELQADKRFPSAADMLTELKKVKRKVESGATEEVEAPTAANPNAAAPTGPSLDQALDNRTIMVIESKMEMQDLMRERLKKAGYRVLILSNPERALARFNDPEKPAADLVIFSAQELGDDAVDAFNTFATGDFTRNLPAILFLDQKQQPLLKTAKLSDRRTFVMMPLKVRELNDAIVSLLTRFGPKPQSA